MIELTDNSDINSEFTRLVGEYKKTWGKPAVQGEHQVVEIGMFIGRAYREDLITNVELQRLIKYTREEMDYGNGFIHTLFLEIIIIEITGIQETKEYKKMVDKITEVILGETKQ